MLPCWTARGGAGDRGRARDAVAPRCPNTHAGKTTLIKALTGDAAAQPRNQLFATLDVTAHAGQLPCRMAVLYMDTIGFLSQLPHGLIESFSATLEDVARSVRGGGGSQPGDQGWVPKTQPGESSLPLRTRHCSSSEMRCGSCLCIYL